VHWLLTSYAPETTIEAAVRSLNTTTQRPSEAVRDFGLRVQQEASLLGSLIPLSELKSLFSQGLRDPVRSNFAAGQGASELLDSVHLTVLIGRAELLERGSAPVGESRPIAPPRPRFKWLYEGDSFSPDRLHNRPEAARYLSTLVTACSDRDTHTLSKLS
jgi:hypothetical protein